MKKAVLAVLLAACLSPAGSADASHCIVLPPDLPDPQCDWLHTHDLEVQIVDPLLCPVLATAAGRYGVVTIDQQGDVFVASDLFWDCPPYQS